MAALLVSALTTGKAQFPDGKELQLAPHDWLEMVRWVYGHVDGPVKTAIETGDAPLRVLIEYSDDNGETAEPAPGAEADQAGA